MNLLCLTSMKVEMEYFHTFPWGGGVQVNLTRPIPGMAVGGQSGTHLEPLGLAVLPPIRRPEAGLSALSA